MAESLERLRGDVAAMAGELFEVIGIPYEQTSELQRQTLAAFAFGMLNVVGLMNRLTPPEVHALAITNLIDTFNYSGPQAATFGHTLVSAAADRAFHPVVNAIIHRGIDGHAQWQAGQAAELRENVADVLSSVGAR